MENINHNSPAFPPQVAQDNLGRLIAPIPGMSKLEYFSIQLLPYFLDSKKEWAKDGQKLNAYQCSVEAAKNLLEILDNDGKKSEDQAIIKTI